MSTFLRIHVDLGYMAYTAGLAQVKPAPCFAVRHYAFIRKKPLASPKQVPSCEVACIPLG